MLPFAAGVDAGGVGKDFEAVHLVGGQRNVGSSCGFGRKMPTYHYFTYNTSEALPLI